MKNTIKEHPVELFAIFAFIVVFCALIYCSHSENVRMIESGYVKQPEQWVKP